MKNPFSIVISEEAAKKYFASANPIGKTLRYNNSYDFVVTGVAKKQPSASTLRFDFVASSASLLSMIPEKELVAANENLFATFFRLRSENDASRLEDGLQRLEKGRQAASEVKSRYIATPLMAMHLTGNGTGAVNTCAPSGLWRRSFCCLPW